MKTLGLNVVRGTFRFYLDKYFKILIWFPKKLKNIWFSEKSSLNSCVMCTAIFFSYLLFIITFPLSVFFCFTMAKEYQRVVTFRFGRLRYNSIKIHKHKTEIYCKKSVASRLKYSQIGSCTGTGPLLHLTLHWRTTTVDLRTVTCIVDPQEILSRGSVTVQVDAVVYHRVSDPVNAVIKVPTPWF